MSNFSWHLLYSLKCTVTETFQRFFLTSLWMKTFRGREGGEEPVDNFSYFSGGTYRYQSSLLYLLNPVPLKPRWPPVTECAWSQWFYGKIEDCEQSSGPPASKHTLPPSPATQSGTSRFNATVYQKYEIYLKKIIINANINDKLKTKQSESS